MDERGELSAIAKVSKKLGQQLAQSPHGTQTVSKLRDTYAAAHCNSLLKLEC